MVEVFLIIACVLLVVCAFFLFTILDNVECFIKIWRARQLNLDQMRLREVRYLRTGEVIDEPEVKKPPYPPPLMHGCGGVGDDDRNL